METASNLTTNFLRYQQRYIDWRLKALGKEGFDALSKKKGVTELLCYMIDMLPIDGRPDLIELKTEVDSLTDLTAFIDDERAKLARMMDVNAIYEHTSRTRVDDTQVDMKLALGFGSSKCIQADFLFPAILEMSRRADIPITAIPSSGPRHRVLMFNSKATDQIMRNLEHFARRYSLSPESGEKISKRYKERLKEVDKTSHEYDLTSIAFFLDVSWSCMNCGLRGFTYWIMINDFYFFPLFFFKKKNYSLNRRLSDVLPEIRPVVASKYPPGTLGETCGVLVRTSQRSDIAT